MPFPGATFHCFFCQIRANLLPTLDIHEQPRTSPATGRSVPASPQVPQTSDPCFRRPLRGSSVPSDHRPSHSSRGVKAAAPFRGRLDTGRVSLSRVGTCAQNANTKLAVGQHLLEFILIQIDGFRNKLVGENRQSSWAENCR